MSIPPRIIDRALHEIQSARPDHCVEWNFARTSQGYGVMSYTSDGKQRIAYMHRVAFEVAYGPIKDGYFICHRCDNPSCINPHHLFQGTPADNQRDMAQKRRSNIGKRLPIGDDHWSKSRPLRGDNNGNSKLSADQVLTILNSSERNVRLAERFGVSQALISLIKQRKVWAHL